MCVNSCDVFLFSAVWLMFILVYAYFFLFQLGGTNEAVHKGLQKPSYATAFALFSLK